MSNEADETFFSRWSRRKAQVRQESTPPARPVAEAPIAGPAGVVVMPAGPRPAAAEIAEPADRVERVEVLVPPAVKPVPTPQPTLDEVRALTPASDFARFVAPGVDAEVKNAAMKKLFADPRFNVMDGLDTYVDDYGRADPIPRAMLRQMVQARVLGLLDDELEEQPLPADAVVQAEAQPPEVVDPLASAPDAVDRIEAAPDAAQPETAPELARLESPQPPEAPIAVTPEPPPA